MQLLPISDPKFHNYGQILDGYDLDALLQVLKNETPIPETGTVYVASEPKLEALPIFEELRLRAYGGMPIQLGYCNGRNTKMNCLEYHRDSELNLGTEDFVLLLAKREDLVNGRLSSDKVVGFVVPKGVLIEVYATSLHYAPCMAKAGVGVQVLVALPRGTNGPKPEIAVKNDEDKLLFACNKWLLAHPSANEVNHGAIALIDGENINIADQI
ncbi:MAG: DUF4867 family protein [Clostridia bacterium]|nr:DUF4867 family protein [Clostridia bacterium]